MRQPRLVTDSEVEADLRRRLAESISTVADQSDEIKQLREVLSVCYGAFLAVSDMPNAPSISSMIEAVLYDPPKEASDGHES